MAENRENGSQAPFPGGASLAHNAWRAARRLVILITGIGTILVGVLMIILPGPAFIVIPAGIAILAAEFVWARRVLTALRDGIGKLSGKDLRGMSMPSIVEEVLRDKSPTSARSRTGRWLAGIMRRFMRDDRAPAPPTPPASAANHPSAGATTTDPPTPSRPSDTSGNS